MSTVSLIGAAELLASPDNELEPMVRISWEAKTIDIFGGESGYSKNDPYWIGFSDAEADWWLYQLAEKNWATPMLIARLDHALRTVREALNG